MEVLGAVVVLQLASGAHSVNAMTSYERDSLRLQALVALGALVIGSWQIKINQRLKKLEDYVAITVVPGEFGVRFLNTGKLNIYIHSIEVLGRGTAYKRPRMIPAQGGDASFYWLPLPDLTAQPVGTEFSITLQITDQHGTKYVSENGGEIVEGNRALVWSERTYKRKWTNESLT